jgi:putative SOS response-associated peptidase YedK
MHDRMPVIIPQRDYDRWLRAEPDRPPIDLMRPFDAERMTAWKVNKAVGNVKNDTAELIEPSTSSESFADQPPKTPGLLFGS